MNWQQLVAARRVQPHRTSRQEIDQLRAVVDRDLKDAGVSATSEDRRYATAYNAVLQLSKMVLACAGYRVTGRQGHHETTFQALKLALGPAITQLADYFDLCRRKRNAVDYDLANVVTETELDELVEKAVGFRDLVEQWISQHYSDLAR